MSHKYQVTCDSLHYKGKVISSKHKTYESAVKKVRFWRDALKNLPDNYSLSNFMIEELK
jgi:hypothetical protein